MEPSSYVVKSTKQEKPMENMHKKFQKSKEKGKRKSTRGEDSFSPKRPKLDEEYQSNDTKQEAIKPASDPKEPAQKSEHKWKEIMEKLLKSKVEWAEDSFTPKRVTQIQSATDPEKIDNKREQKTKEKSDDKRNIVSKRRAKRGKDTVPSKKHKSKGHQGKDTKREPYSPAPGGLVFDPRDPFALSAEDEVRLRKRPSKFFCTGIRKSILYISAINIPEPAIPPKEKSLKASLSKCNKHSKKHFGSKTKAKSQIKILQIKKKIITRVAAAKGNVTEPQVLTTDPKFLHPKALFLESIIDPTYRVLFDLGIHPMKKKKTSPTPFVFSYGEQSPDRNVVRPKTPFWESIDHCEPTDTDLSGKWMSPDAQMLARSHNWPQNMDSFDPNKCPTPTDNSNSMFPQVWTFVAPVTAVDDKIKKGPRILRFPSKVDLSNRLLAKFPKLNNTNIVRTELPSSATATTKLRPKRGPKIKAKDPGTYKERKYTRKPKPEPVLVEVLNVEFQFVDLCDPASGGSCSVTNEHPQELLFTTPDGSELHVPIDNLENSLVPWDGEAKVLYIEPFPTQTTVKRPRGRPPKRTIVPPENPLPLLDFPKITKTSMRKANTNQEPLDAIPKVAAEETEARAGITDAEAAQKTDALIAYVEAILAGSTLTYQSMDGAWMEHGKGNTEGRD